MRKEFRISRKNAPCFAKFVFRKNGFKQKKRNETLKSLLVEQKHTVHFILKLSYFKSSFWILVYFQLVRMKGGGGGGCHLSFSRTIFSRISCETSFLFRDKTPCFTKYLCVSQNWFLACETKQNIAQLVNEKKQFPSNLYCRL